MPASHLPDRALIAISGADAQTFLHNLITTDVEAIAPKEAAPGALLTPQGKLFFDFLIWRHEDHFLLETDESQADGLLKRLTLYKLRAKVDIKRLDDEGVTVFWNDDLPADGIRDLRFAAAGLDLVRKPGRHAGADGDAYDGLRIAAGIVVSGRDFSLEDAFPHDVMLDLTRGVSFKKGCYVGQEVVSRMHHRKSARKRPVIVTAQGTLPATGTPLTAAGKPIGTLGSVSGNAGLAIVRVDRAGEAMAAQLPVLAGDLPVTLRLPDWSGLAFPTASEDA
ncbi:YgfZ/GcvT domain-containing protein [Rhizobium halophytocola]|uniref:Folate-binding protein YgfZ n=1 Tax=Rhizobium halophytocola TaxID=735519 RepID=A0ABS4DYQ4_9HYPH|nr:folate-binding protein YgfZ [Rhizobium halophytocola]MBP1850818.1 folate-binding protein YgfZ [Rhizobium halophytocola]